MTDTAKLAAALADRYRIERELGAGGMATVFLAHDLRHDRKVAVKVLRPELAVVIGADRFLAEIKTTANLQHPHILPLHDSGQVEGTVFYVMPLVEGESLRDRLTREKQLPVDDAVKIVSAVASALDYAHRHGVIHRDIKPENILLHDGQAMIADFGIALAASNTGNTRMTETGMSLGTPHYMSPEQAMGERTLDARSDVYSLGAVLYELLTGEPPHTGGTVQAIVAKVLSEQPIAISRTRSMVPPNVEAAVQRALAKTPADRFSTAAEFAAALANPAFRLPSSALASQASGSRPGIWNPVSIASTAAAAILLAIMIVGWTKTPAASGGETRWQRISMRNPPMDDIRANVGVAIAPDGSSIAYFDTIGGRTRLWLKPRGVLNAVPVSGSEFGLTSASSGVVYSPDSKSVAFIYGNRIRRLPVGGGSPVTISDSASPSAAWLDDDTILVVSIRNQLRRVSANGGPVTTLVSTVDSQNPRGVVGVTALPDSRGAFMTTCIPGCARVGIWTHDLRTGTSKPLVEDAVRAFYVAPGYVAYVRRDGAVFAAPFDLATLELRGDAVPVFDGVRTSVGAAAITMALNGDVLYLAGTSGDTGDFELAWVSRDGTAVPVDTSWKLAPGVNSGLSLSPDGKRLAINVLGPSTSDIWVKQLDRGPLTRVTFDGTRNFRPAWSPDGQHVLYSSDREPGSSNAYRTRSDGLGKPELVLDLQSAIQEVHPSRDGKWLVLRTGGVAGQAGGRDIVAIRPGVDTVPTPVVAEARFDATAAALSPDGRWIAYESTESGSSEVYVRPFPNTSEGMTRVSTRGGFGPIWSRDSKELFYLNTATEMVAVSVLPGPRFAGSEEKVLFPANMYNRGLNYRQYDISPDGKRFIMMRNIVRPGEMRRIPDLIYIENWASELRAKIKN